MSLSYGFALGGVLQTICALVVLPAFDWRWLVALTSVLSIVPLLLSPCLPESPRFYVAAGSMSRARQSLASIASMNRVAVPSVARPAPLRAVVAGTDRGADRGGVTARQREQQLRASLGRFSDVCRRGMGRYTFPLAAVWIGVSVAYMWQMFLASSLLGSARLSETCVSAVAEDSSVPTGAWSKRETCDTVSRNDLWEVFMYVAWGGACAGTSDYRRGSHIRARHAAVFAQLCHGGDTWRAAHDGVHRENGSPANVGCVDCCSRPVPTGAVRLRRQDVRAVCAVHRPCPGRVRVSNRVRLHARRVPVITPVHRGTYTIVCVHTLVVLGVRRVWVSGACGSDCTV